MSNPRRTTDDSVLNSTTDNYSACPNCGGYVAMRDLRDSVFSCHECGFTHSFNDTQTVAQALASLDAYNTREEQQA